MKNEIFNILKEKYNDMSKGHKKIADYLLEHYDKASFMTASKLGSTVGISESTVVRFATELGFDGYPSFQQSIRDIMRTRLTSIQRIEIASTQIGNEDILDKVLDLDIERIELTKEQTSKKEFYSSVETILNAKKIYIIGSRSAEPLARFLNYYFNVMFEDVKLLNASGASELLQQLFHIDKNDVVIGISFPRYSKQTAIALKYALSMNANVISVTDSEFSPIAEFATHLLLARSDMLSFVDSFVAPLSLLNALIIAISIKKQEDLKSNFERLEQIWDEHDVYEKSKD